ALYSLAPRGRHVQIGLFDAEPVLSVSRIIAQEITFLGSHGMAAADYQPMLDLIAAGRLRPQDLVTRHLTLAEAPAAVDGRAPAPRDHDDPAGPRYRCGPPHAPDRGSGRPVRTRIARFDDRARRSSWLVWVAGVGVYFLAVLHRASLGVAGPDAVARLDISATELGAFIMVQLGIYALMQVPAGMLLDQWGPRRVLLVATLIMGAAQLL